MLRALAAAGDQLPEEEVRSLESVEAEEEDQVEDDCVDSDGDAQGKGPGTVGTVSRSGGVS